MDWRRWTLEDTAGRIFVVAVVCIILLIVVAPIWHYDHGIDQDRDCIAPPQGGAACVKTPVRR